MKTIAVQVIKTYHIDAESEEAVQNMSSTRIAEEGNLIDITVDYVETVEDLDEEDDED